MKEREPHEIEALLRRIQPALRDVDRSKSVEEQISQGIEMNVREAVLSLLRLPDVQKAQREKNVKILGAIYSVRTGKVRVLDIAAD